MGFNSGFKGLMAVADINYRFVCVDIGSYGKGCDCTIFKRSSYGHKFRQFCWNYSVRVLFQEQKVHVYHTSL